MNSPYSPEQQARINAAKVESVEEFLARGGAIQTKAVSKKKTKSKINAQALFSAAEGTALEREVIQFLATQGIEVN